MLIGFIIFGSKHSDYGELHWSFAFSVIGAIFCLVASVLAIVQMKQSNVIWWRIPRLPWYWTSLVF